METLKFSRSFLLIDMYDVTFAHIHVEGQLVSECSEMIKNTQSKTINTNERSS